MYSDISYLEKARTKRGFKKIQFACEQAKRDKLDYAWIDSCCIDQSNSAELSESINSMFQSIQDPEGHWDRTYWYVH